jgi:hypothetical protein
MDHDLRLDLGRLSIRLRDITRLLEQGACTPAEAAKMLRELVEDVDRLQPPLRLSSYLQQRGV